MSHEIKYGWVSGGRQGREYKVAASQYFNRLGGHFVYADTAGNITLAVSTTTTLLGWAEVPKDAAGKSAWMSSSTAGADKVFVITDPTAIYAIPGAAAVNATQIGNACDIVMTNATYALLQSANVGTTSTDVLRIEGFPEYSATVALVKINYAKFQADT
jgi:hypothetical protein